MDMLFRDDDLQQEKTKVAKPKAKKSAVKKIAEKVIDSVSKKHYYSLKKILAEKADYNIIIGERSNGKTYACLKYIVEDFYKTGKQGAYIRRWKDDIIGKRAENIFTALVASGEVKEITNNEYDNIIFSRGKWYLSFFEEDTRRMKCNPKPLCFAFALSDMEHDKSVSYPDVNNIVFDEFLTTRYYLPDEFVLYMNVLSTIIRERDGVKIFMLGNTVTKFSPYFSEMGITNIENMEQGTIDLYSYGDSTLKIAVEYCNPTKNGKKSNKYFAFDNPKLNMITSGKWQLNIYPHLPAGYKIAPDSIMFRFCILFNNKTVSGDVVNQNDDLFLYIHAKTTPIKKDEILYTLDDYTPSPLTRKCFLQAYDKIDNKIKAFFSFNRVFYQNNEIGELVKNYIVTCAKSVAGLS